MNRRDRMLAALFEIRSSAEQLRKWEARIDGEIHKASALGLSLEAIDAATRGYIDCRDLPEEGDFQRKGGRARAAALTPEQRSAIARKAAAARWHKGGE